MNDQPNHPASGQPVARGFALYIGVDADTAAANGTSLS
ncbi:MAG: hypothetical protein RLZZ514_1183, partial [Actinomycetota bacterium]